MTEFEFERGELLSNLTLLEDHAQKFPCPYCMEKHLSKIIGYGEEIAMGKEGDEKMLEELAERWREDRRRIQDLKGHSHSHAEGNPGVRAYLPHGLTECEKAHPKVRAKLARCIKKLEPRERTGEIESAVAVCRASISCP